MEEKLRKEEIISKYEGDRKPNFFNVYMYIIKEPQFQHLFSGPDGKGQPDMAY
jgi:hypothetical protein